MSSLICAVGLTLEGDVSSFGATERERLTEDFKRALGCRVPTCYLSLSITGGSVTATATLTIPDAPASISTPPAVIITQAVNNFVQSRSAISNTLGVTVTAVAPVAVTAQVVPIVVAPLPPPSPPSPPPTANITSTPSSDSSSGGGGNDSSFVIVIIVAVIIVLIVIAGAAYMVHKNKKRSSTMVKAVPVAAASVTTTSTTDIEMSDGDKI
jgi:hypothetical protein